jgi:hypothetical protein
MREKHGNEECNLLQFPKNNREDASTFSNSEREREREKAEGQW